MEASISFNVKALSNDQIDEVRKEYTSKNHLNLIGYKVALPLLNEDEGVLEIRFYGEAIKQDDGKCKRKTILKDASYYRFMNSFPA